jgi:hypothetical protein
MREKRVAEHSRFSLRRGAHGSARRIVASQLVKKFQPGDSGEEQSDQ